MSARRHVVLSLVCGPKVDFLYVAFHAWVLANYDTCDEDETADGWVDDFILYKAPLRDGTVVHYGPIRISDIPDEYRKVIFPKPR